MTPLATAIPGSSNNGYVAAAYIVFFAIVLIYVAIMALRLTRVERGLRELNERARTPRDVATQGEIRQDGPGENDAHSQARERETV
jgi:hypothetical protein